MRPARLAPWLVACALVAPPDASAADEGPLYARVVAARTTVRAQPDPAARSLVEARVGWIFRATTRSTRGDWLGVRLDDGAEGFVPRHDVYVFDPDEAPDEALPQDRVLVAPSPDARVELAVSAGLLGRTFGADAHGGLFVVRPALRLHPALALELTGAVGVAGARRTHLAGLGLVASLAPRSPVVPFLAAGGGWAYTRAQDDAWLPDGGAPLAWAGGGLRLCFRGGVVLRVDVRAHLFFDAGTVEVREEATGGLAAFF